MIRSTSLTNRTDAELLLASLEDPDAFGVLYDRWAAPLLGYFVNRVRDVEVAADLVAETLAVVFEKRSRFRDTGDPASAWLYTIAGRELSRYLRRRRVEFRALQRLGLTRPAVDEESACAIEALIDHDADEHPLAAALQGISKSEREAVELRVFEELEYRTRGGCDCGPYPHSNKCNASSVGSRRPSRRHRDRDAASDQCDRPAKCPPRRAGDPKQGRCGPRQLQGLDPSGLFPLEYVFGLQGDDREPMVAARLDRDHGRQAGSPRRD
jgi:RNA polymerase sigma factor (sigma-70 family)